MKWIYALFLSCLSIILFSDCEVSVSNKLGVLSYYTVTNTSPQTVGVGWTETAKDVYGNDVHVDLDTMLNLTSSTGNITFHTDGTYTTTTTSGVICKSTTITFNTKTHTRLTSLHRNEGMIYLFYAH